MHGLHLLVQLLGLQHRVGEGSVDAGQESFHQLGVNLALLHGGGEKGEVDLDQFGGQAANNIIVDMDGEIYTSLCKLKIDTYLSWLNFSSNIWERKHMPKYCALAEMFAL